MPTLRQIGKADTKKVVVCGAHVWIRNGIAEVTRSQKDCMMTVMWRRRNGFQGGFEDITPTPPPLPTLPTCPTVVENVVMKPIQKVEPKPIMFEKNVQAPIKYKFKLSVLIVIESTDREAIKKSLLSLYCQNFKDFEVIIINDKDDIFKMLDELPGLKYKYVFFPEGKSYNDSLKMALALRESELVMHIKDYSILEDNVVQESIRTAETLRIPVRDAAVEYLLKHETRAVKYI